MSLLKIPGEQAKYLATFPETAMGFQLLELRPKLSEFDLFLVLNSEFLIRLSEPSQLYSDLRILSELGPDPDKWEAEHIELTDGPQGGEMHIFTAPSTRLATSLLDVDIEWKDKIKSFFSRQKIIAISSTKGTQAYFRMSAFKNDRRIGHAGEFLPGTYATTYNDIRLIPSGYAAVGRYALPNPNSAKYMFSLVTKTAPTYVGTAVPNFGQAGGGVEVYFKQGAKPIAGEPWEVAEA